MWVKSQAHTVSGRSGGCPLGVAGAGETGGEGREGVSEIGGQQCQASPSQKILGASLGQ